MTVDQLLSELTNDATHQSPRVATEELPSPQDDDSAPERKPDGLPTWTVVLTAVVFVNAFATFLAGCFLAIVFIRMTQLGFF